MDNPKTLIEFMETYKTEEDCRQALFEHRWPDGLSSYRPLAKQGFDHQPLVVGEADASELFPWVHIIISNFKRWILDAFHGVSAKYLQSYLDEFCYRLNRRKQRTDLFRRALNRCVRFTEPVTYAQLIAC